MSAMTAQPGVTIFKDELVALASKYKILVPVANPATLDDLLDLATSLAKERKGEVVALHVVETENGFPADEERVSASARRTILEQMVAGRRRTSVPIHTVTRIDHSAADGIVSMAREDGYSLILLGWQGRMRPVSLGSSLGEVLDPVVKNAPCSVAVVKNPRLGNVRRILVPTAGGPHAALALELALMLARRFHAQVTLLNIAKKGQEEAGRRIIERTLQQVKTRQTVQQQVVVADHVVKGILRETRDYDVVILGASQEGIFQQILFGVIPEQVAKRCTKTVIMVKGAHGPLVTGLRRLWTRWSSFKPGTNPTNGSPKGGTATSPRGRG
jgi:nucleotide-binding universal stress UspA family protein